MPPKTRPPEPGDVPNRGDAFRKALMEMRESYHRRLAEHCFGDMLPPEDIARIAKRLSADPTED